MMILMDLYTAARMAGDLEHVARREVARHKRLHSLAGNVRRLHTDGDSTKSEAPVMRAWLHAVSGAPDGPREQTGGLP